MQVTLSPAQVGYIVKTIYPDTIENPDILNLWLDLCASVKEYFLQMPYGEQFYEQWFSEWTELAEFCRP